MKEIENQETHINLICELVQQLRDLGATIEDRWMIAILLSSLPDYFDNVADTLEARPIRDLTWGIVTAKLLDANNRRKERSGSIEKMERLLLTKGTAREAPICNYCQKPNHIEKFCRIKKADQKRERKSSEDEQSDDERGQRALLLSLCEVNEKAPTTWIIDSGRKRHVCNDNNKFTSITRLEREIEFELPNGTITPEV